MNRLDAAKGRATAQLRFHAEAALMVAASTLLGHVLAPRAGSSAVDLLFLPAVLAAAVLGGRGPALLAALASALAYNFYFTEPRHTFHVENPNDLVTVVVLFGVALVTSQLAASVRRQARVAEAHAARNATVAGLARRLLSCTSEQEVADTSVRELGKIFECNIVLIDGTPEPRPLASAPVSTRLTPSDLAVAATVLDSGKRAGRGIGRGSPIEWQFHPVRSSKAAIAVMGLARDDGAPPVRGDRLALLDNLLDQVALALERGRLEVEAREFARVRERDQVRSVLISTIGEDLKRPLKAIRDALTGLRRSGSADKALASLAASEAASMERYLSNLLELEPESDQRPVEVDGVTIDLFRRAVFRDGVEVHLTPKEYAVLAELAKHPGRVLAHGHLLRTAWGPAQERQIDYLRVAIRGLRQKLERNSSRPELILNEPAVGYRLKADAWNARPEFDPDAEQPESPAPPRARDAASTT
jgi:two-component system sensor histidine kinase KdpD